MRLMIQNQGCTRTGTPNMRQLKSNWVRSGSNNISPSPVASGILQCVHLTAKYLTRIGALVDFRSDLRTAPCMLHLRQRSEGCDGLEWATSGVPGHRPLGLFRSCCG